jgi:hypothetical protein
MGFCIYCRCPGIFKTVDKGCGGKLVPLRRLVPQDNSGPAELIECWSCEKYPQCDFKEFIQKRLYIPQVSLEAVDRETFKVACKLPSFAS